MTEPKKLPRKPRKKNLRELMATTLTQRAEKRRDSIVDLSTKALGKRRPWAKKDSWVALTVRERERILARSRAHIARQQVMGVPMEDRYGPALVLKFREYGLKEPARWREKLTHGESITD